MNASIIEQDDLIQEYYASIAEEYEREDEYWREIYEDMRADEIISENKNK